MNSAVLAGEKSTITSAGPQDEKTRTLIKLAISISAHLEGSAHSHVRKAIDAGATKPELYHIALLAIPTIGLPSTMAVLSWIDDIVQSKSGRHQK